MTKEMEFDYYIDKKYTIWGRERYTIVAELKEKADEIMMDIFEHGDTHGLCYDFEYNYETSEDLQPEDNGGESTKELYEENGNLIITNQNQMTDKIIDFDDWVEYTMERGDFPETELREFEEHYQNLLDYEANILHFITFKLNKTLC